MSTQKVPIPTVADALTKYHADPALLRAVIEELNLRVQSDDEEEKAPAVKKQFVILVSDPDGLLTDRAGRGMDFVGWVLQIPEDESVATTQNRINRAAYEFNASKKGRLLPVKTVGEAVENVPARFFKQADVSVKTKVPVLVMRTNNEIPKERKSEGDLKEARTIDAAANTGDAVIAVRIDGDERTQVVIRDGKFVLETSCDQFRSKKPYDTEAEAMEAFNESDAA